MLQCAHHAIIRIVVNFSSIGQNAENFHLGQLAEPSTCKRKKILY